MTKFSCQPVYLAKLRTSGLKSEKGAMFGMTRTDKKGNPRAHQGIDLAIDNNYRVYAVENGTVVEISKGLNGYGFTITLKLDCEHKPELHNKYAFYSHLKRIDVEVGKIVEASYVIALTGDTGNAKGMTTEAKGSHLHFEIRTKQICGKGLTNRIDPLPFIELKEKRA